MSILKNVLENWIQIVDYENKTTIDDYGYDTGVIEGTTGNHCIKCVAVNQCYFKDEKSKKPEIFDITGIKVLDILINGLTPGLYHPFCHCVETPTYIEQIDEICLIVPPSKIEYLFRKKLEWVKAMGYYENDRDMFVKMLLQKTKEAYFYGNYYIEGLSKYGCKINLKLTIPGYNNKKGKDYKIETNYMVFPNKKLKMNTPIGGWQ